MDVLKKYILHIVILALALILGVSKVLPLFITCLSNFDDMRNKKAAVLSLTKDVELAKKSTFENVNKEKEVVKLIYEAQSGVTSEAMVFNLILETVLEKAKNAGMKVKTIEFKNMPESDPLVQNHNATINSKLLDTELIGTYTEFQNFLRDIYRYEYMMSIQSIEITPYEFDKKILLIKLSLGLYAKK